MPKPKRNSKKRKYTKKKTKKYGYAYKKKKTYKKRKQQKGGVKCLTVNSVASPHGANAGRTPPVGLVYKSPPPDILRKMTFGLISETIQFPIKISATEPHHPNILVFWYDDYFKTQRDQFVTALKRELGKENKKTHWIWWVYPNIIEITGKTEDAFSHELSTIDEYKLLWENDDYRDIRSIADGVSKDGEFINWFSSGDTARMSEFEKVHKGEMLSGLLDVTNNDLFKDKYDDLKEDYKKLFAQFKIKNITPTTIKNTPFDNDTIGGENEIFILLYTNLSYIIIYFIIHGLINNKLNINMNKIYVMLNNHNKRKYKF